jgi:hypothetical protein
MTTNRKIAPAAHFGLLAVTLTFLTGCSGPAAPEVPTAGDAEKQLSERVIAESEGRAKLVSFQQTDGQHAVTMGVSFFRLKFEGQVEFNEACKWLQAANGAMFQTRKPPTGDATIGWGKYFEDSKYPGVMVKKGQREKIGGTLVFSKTDKAWSVPTIEK